MGVGARDAVGWRRGGITSGFWARLRLVVMLLLTLTWETRAVAPGRGKWLAMIERYQLRTGGRLTLADPEGSYSQRIAARTLARGAANAITVTIVGSLFFTATGGQWFGPQRFNAGGW